MDPVESAARWHQWSVKGSDGVIAQVLDRLEATAPPEWKRLREEELQPYQPLVRPGSAWYSLDVTPVHAGVTLSVERLRDTELRGGRVWFTGPDPQPVANIPAAWDQINRFLDQRIVEAARAARAEVWVPTASDLFLADLSAYVVEHLRRFSRDSRKLLPLNPDEADRWRSFVIGAFQAKAVVDARHFVDWLVCEGWERETATELSLRFFDQCQLLTRYADEVSAA
jgi:hypothetical protein